MSSEVPEDTVGYTLHGNRYLNVTNRCNLYCDFCPRMHNDWNVQSHDLNLHHEPSAEELIDAAGDVRNFNEIVFCGLGEPTIRLYTLLRVAKALKRKGASIRLNTNGLGNQYHNRDITPDLEDVIDSISVSLNAQNAQVYAKHCRPRTVNAYESLLAFIRSAKSHVDQVSLTAIEGLENVDIQACSDVAKRLGADFRCRKLDEVG